MTTTTEPTIAIGKRPIRQDGVDKVTGRAVYGNDVKLSGLLYAKMLRSPHAHARIVSIDTSAAAALPGVKAIVTGADLPMLADKVEDLGEGEVNMRYASQNVLAHTKVLYHGHAVAAVAATSANIAEEAVKLIKVVYEVLPPVLSTREAIKPGAPIIQADLRTDELGQKGTQPTNIAKHEQHLHGDLAQGFKDADVIVEREFNTAMVHQGYIEPHAATSLWSADGNITIWCSTQGAHAARNQTADILTVPIGRIKVIPTEIGGGFGGKIGIYLEPVTAVLSRKAGGVPVKMAMNRADVLMATGPTSGSYIKVKIGAKKDGTITAAQALLEYEAGAFPGSPFGSAMSVIFAPYKLANVQIDGYDVLVNKPKTAAYRAPGGTNAAFASESVIDELAEKLGIDPLEMRRINGVKEGDRRADGPTYKRIGYLETLAAAAQHPHYTAPLGAPAAGHGRGRGVASGFWFNWGGKSSLSATVNSDGTISLLEGSTDIGGSRTSIAMQLAESLGIPSDRVKPAVGDTDAVGYNDVTGGSRTTYGTGWAAWQCGQNLKAILVERAAKYWECDVKDVTYERGVFKHHTHAMTFAELADKLDDTGGPVVSAAAVDAGGGAVSFGTHIVDVDVDLETGKTEVLRYTAVQDVGKAIYPPYVEGQIQGGAAQGAGWALSEEYWYDKDGHLMNASLLDYRMPTTLDLPMIEPVLIEVPSDHPYGVRGVGEVPIVPPAGAIANAVRRAIGTRMFVLPMSPARVLEATGKIAA